MAGTSKRSRRPGARAGDCLRGKGIASPDQPREPKQSWRPQGPTGLDVRDHDRAPSLLYPDCEQAGSRSCVGRGRTDGLRELDHAAATRLGRSGHLNRCRDKRCSVSSAARAREARMGVRPLPHSRRAALRVFVRDACRAYCGDGLDVALVARAALFEIAPIGGRRHGQAGTGWQVRAHLLWCQCEPFSERAPLPSPVRELDAGTFDGSARRGPSKVRHQPPDYGNCTSRDEQQTLLRLGEQRKSADKFAPAAVQAVPYEHQPSTNDDRQQHQPNGLSDVNPSPRPDTKCSQVLTGLKLAVTVSEPPT